MLNEDDTKKKSLYARIRSGQLKYLNDNHRLTDRKLMLVVMISFFLASPILYYFTDGVSFAVCSIILGAYIGIGELSWSKYTEGFYEGYINSMKSDNISELDDAAKFWNRNTKTDIS